MLELHTALVCTSAMQNESLKLKALQRAKASAMSMKLDPLPERGSQDEENEGQNGAEIHICSGCMARERKRARVAVCDHAQSFRGPEPCATEATGGIPFGRKR